MKRVVIVGGGIAGLAAAHQLSPLPFRGEGAGVRGETGITLLESSSRLGGKIITERLDDFVIEGGPDSFLSVKQRGLGLCLELGLIERLHGTNEKFHRTYVMRSGQLLDLPEGLTGLIPSRFGPMLKTNLISPLGKLRMGMDYLIPPRRELSDESLAMFIRRRLGREVYERLVEPLMSGIYAGDGEQLSLAATFPQLRQAELEQGSLVRGVLAAKKKASDKPKTWPAFLSLTNGMAEVVEALAKKLDGVEIRLGTRVDRLDADSSGYAITLGNGETLGAKAIVLATPAPITAELVANFDSELARALSEIPHVSTATISVAYRLADIPRPLNGYGYIIPRAEGRPILACTWTSTKFPHRAPEGYALIRAFVGRAGQEEVPERSDEDLLKLVRDELRATLGITAPPMFHRIFRWPLAMPQYTLGHLDRLAAIEKRLATHPGLFIAGNAYRGVGIPDCIQSGEAAAEGIISFLKDEDLLDGTKVLA